MSLVLMLGLNVSLRFLVYELVKKSIKILICFRFGFFYNGVLCSGDSFKLLGCDRKF